jgi:uncharacterized protein (DUF2141 family)
MKTLLTSIIFLLIASIVSAQDSFTLKVTVNNVTTDKGKVLFSLNTENQFMKAAPLQASSSEIKDGVASVIFENVSPGEYAVMIFHDKNENNKMDFQPNGMPDEPYGMSNNPMSYGPPTWDDAKFSVDADKEILIRL